MIVDKDKGYISIPFGVMPLNCYVTRPGWIKIVDNKAEFWCLDDDEKTPIKFSDYCEKIKKTKENN